MCRLRAWLASGLVWLERMGIRFRRGAAARQTGYGELNPRLCELAEERLSFPLGAVILPLPEFAGDNAESGAYSGATSSFFFFRRIDCGFHPVSQGPWQ